MSSKKANKKRSRSTTSRRRATSNAGQARPLARISIPRPRVTDYTTITSVPVFSIGVEGSPAGSAGTYDVVFVLGVPGVNSVGTAMNADDLLRGGDSLLQGRGLQAELHDADGNVFNVADIVPNGQGRLARVHLKVTAETFAVAEREAYDQVMPVLSRLAFDTDVPLEVTATVITEEATGSVRMGATLIGAVQPAPEFAGLSTPELRPFLAVYREGLNSNTVLYQALSFYKVIEGVAAFHTKRVRDARRSGGAPSSDPMADRIPSVVEDLPAAAGPAYDLFAPYLGKTFAEVKDDMQHTVRNAIAHLTPSRDIRVADYLDDVRACRQAVPVLRYIARRLIQGEISALAANASALNA